MNYKSNVSSLTTYQNSKTFKKSQLGFDRRSYNSWKECYETVVIPMAIKCEKLEMEILDLKKKLASK